MFFVFHSDIQFTVDIIKRVTPEQIKYIVNMLTSKQKQRIKRSFIEKNGSICYYCGDLFSFENLTLDHIYPASLSRASKKHDKKNMLLSCKPCNLTKGSRVLFPEEFRKETMGARYVPFSVQKQLENLNKKTQKKKKIKKAKKPKKVYPKCDVKAIKPLLFKEVIFLEQKKSLVSKIIEFFS